MGGVVIRIGIIGMSEGNGHPFSFSAIINGYSEPDLAVSGWKVIHDYVIRRDPSEFGFPDVRVTHAWTQDAETTRKLCRASRIDNAAVAAEEMIGSVDAVILARDDFENHLAMALPFLKSGLHVFVDKPLTVESDELRVFRPFLESGKLMSCSGMRYARELDEARAALDAYGEIRLVRGAILNSWEKYGIHLVDAILNVVRAKPVSVMPLEAPHASMAIRMDDDSLVQLDVLGDVGGCFRIDFFGTRKVTAHEIADNFAAFRRTLWHFIDCIKTGRPAIPPEQTITAMRVLMAGRMARGERRKVALDEL